MSSRAVKLDEYVVQDDGICGGKPRIAGTRLKVQHIVVEYERLGMSPDEICDAHPGLTLAAVHSAIAYYYDNRCEILDAIRNDEEFAESVRANLKSVS